MHEPGLCEITLGGFETFDEPTRIPIGRLTFLFGPNSAGKSSIEDGIRLLNEVCDTGGFSEFDDEPIASFESDHVSCRSRLLRAWRRTGDAPDSYADLMQIGASALIDGWDNLTEDVTHFDGGTYNPPSPGLHLLEAIVRFKHRRYPPVKWFRSGALQSVSRDIAFSLDGVPLLEFTDHAEAALNFGHPLLIRLPIPEACRVAERSRPAHVSTTGGWLRFRGGMVYDDEKRLDQRSYQESWRWNDVEGLECEESWPPPPEMTHGLSCFAEVFDRVLQNSCSVMGRALKPYTVPASRTTPEPRELSFLFDGQSGRESEHAGFHITMHGDRRYRRLAWSFRAGVLQDMNAMGSEATNHAHSLHDRVNRMLTGHLFREYGYQLKADYRVLMTPEQFESRQRLDDAVKAGAGQGFSLLIEIHLEDPRGRRYAFTEVGSGLGYVLPVLAAACDESLPVVVVQQPELHLHPALQAELGDVFVELSRGGRRLIIETHSEHLLLRVLRRLRQSGNATGINPDLHIEPDDVAILYFDPHLDGTTKVKRLRVSADGEFLDRWPRGFFTERDEELFDE